MSGSHFPADLNFGSKKTRWFLTTWFVATFALGTYGYTVYDREGEATNQAAADSLGAPTGAVAAADPAVGSEPAHHSSISTSVYYTAQLFLLHAPHFEHRVNWALELARWLAALFTGFTVYKFAKRVVRAALGARRLSNATDHVIICGFGRKGYEFARYERNKLRSVVVIDQNDSAEAQEACREIGAVFMAADATQSSTLHNAGVHRAAALYALCGEDSANCEIAAQVNTLLGTSTGNAPAVNTDRVLTCKVHMSDIDLRDELQKYQNSVRVRRRTDIKFFDLYDLDARSVLLEELPIDHDGIHQNTTRRAHLVLLGFGRMGRSMAIRAAKLGHFANAAYDERLRLRISVIDRDAAQAEEALLFRYPNIRKCCDMDFHSHPVESGSARRLLEEWNADTGTLTSVVVSFDNEPRAVEVTSRMLPAFRAHGTRVAVRLAQRTGLAEVGRNTWTKADGTLDVRLFGGLAEQTKHAIDEDSMFERIAIAIHSDFVQKRMKDGREPNSDPAMADWKLLHETLRESNRQQAQHIAIKLRAVGCEMADLSDPRPALEPFNDNEVVETLSRMEHNRWNAERWLDGWTFAPGMKDLDLRTSPYLRPWSELEGQVLGWDREAVQEIPKRLKEVGKKIVKRRP